MSLFPQPRCFFFFFLASLLDSKTRDQGQNFYLCLYIGHLYCLIFKTHNEVSSLRGTSHKTEHLALFFLSRAYYPFIWLDTSWTTWGSEYVQLIWKKEEFSPLVKRKLSRQYEPGNDQQSEQQELVWSGLMALPGTHEARGHCVLKHRVRPLPQGELMVLVDTRAQDAAAY